MMLDITAPSHVEIEIREDGHVVWVNVDGECVLRACRIDCTLSVTKGDQVLYRLVRGTGVSHEGQGD